MNKEINAQLEGLRVIVKTCDKLTIEQAVALMTYKRGVII